VLPPLPATLVGLVFAAACLFIAEDKEYIGAVMLGIIAICCFSVAMASYSLSAGPKGFNTWGSIGAVRHSSLEVSSDHLVEVIAFSFYSNFSAMWYHYLQLRRSRDLAKNVLDFWVGEDAVSAATTLASWLNERRPPSAEVIALITSDAHLKS
jgi:hypothetical protein